MTKYHMKFPVSEECQDLVDDAEKLERFEIALLNIKKHCEFCLPTGYEFDSTWHIANNALMNISREN
jgi:hypothetical protein